MAAEDNIRSAYLQQLQLQMLRLWLHRQPRLQQLQLRLHFQPRPRKLRLSPVKASVTRVPPH